MKSVHVGRRAVSLAPLFIAFVAWLAVVSSSHATFRGQNGQLVFQAQVGANTQLFKIAPDGTGLTQITHFKDSSGTNAAWSTDGSRIVFTRNWNAAQATEKIVLYTVRANGTGLKALPKAGNLAVSPNWFPDRRRIVFLEIHSGKLMVINANGSGLRSAGIPGSGGDAVCFLPDGKRVAFLRPKPGNDHLAAIFVAGLFAHGLKRVTPWGSYADKIDCSPDGKRIVFSKPEFSQGSGGSSNVFTVRTDGSDLVQLTHESDGTINDGADSWSPDGTKIAYVSNKTGTYQIWIMNADGTEQTKLTKGAEGHLAAWGSHR